MDKIDREEAGWVVALSWLSALEETARDFHGTRPYVFSARAYEHSVQYYLHLLGDGYGIQIKKSNSIRAAVENYIQIGVAGGLFRDASFFELAEVNPFHLEITVHDCVYLKSCQALIEEGFSVRDLTCARIGCFRAAVKALANIDCEYHVTSFNIDGDCKGYIERT
ncbi:MAG: hypothetical protein A2V76_01160 [Candidatus Aminicenantes bacterium RBG_16_63_14]|nr:MAG: hypothetical protein A2V76_01160 [Candidatus Aminicenantes bacterium RBG_16_63_14]OGD29215.1 MAG: hypothetical protein A2V57_08320 [Candidatus Aminicenantes bacterium RBG_19FT_COMBO_65_30]